MLKVDFLPERIRTQRERRAALSRQVVLMGVCVLGLVVLGFARQGRLQMAQAQMRVLREKTADVERQLAYRIKLEEQQADLLVKKRITDEVGSRVNTLDILAALQQVLPPSIFMTSLSMETVETTQDVAPVASKDPKRKEKAKPIVTKRIQLVFTGVASNDVDVANVIAQLSACKLFEDVNMVYVRKSDFRGQSVREFRANCFLVR